ncbi:hypothetical protein GCM10010431_61570 [Streptomyces kunmingensis]
MGRDIDDASPDTATGPRLLVAVRQRDGKNWQRSPRGSPWSGRGLCRGALPQSAPARVRACSRREDRDLRIPSILGRIDVRVIDALREVHRFRQPTDQIAGTHGVGGGGNSAAAQSP